MGNLGGPEIVVILLVALIFLGPSKMPDVARQVGRAMAEVRKVTAGFQREMTDALNDDSDARSRGEAIAATRPVPAAPAEPAPAEEPSEPAAVAEPEVESSSEPNEPSSDEDR